MPAAGAACPPSVEIPVDEGIASALGLDLSGAPAVLPDTEGRVSWSGPLEDDTTVLLSAVELRPMGAGGRRLRRSNGSSPSGGATGSR